MARRPNLTISGISTDGTASNSGTKNGFLKKMKDQLPHLLNGICVAHTANLPIKDLLHDNPHVNQILSKFWDIKSFRQKICHFEKWHTNWIHIIESRALGQRSCKILQRLIILRSCFLGLNKKKFDFRLLFGIFLIAFGEITNMSCKC